MRWLISEYQPTTLFSLKMSNATSSAAKSLVCPTPYAVKMALLDAALRTLGRDGGAALFPIIRDLKVAVILPEFLVVSNCFIKVQDPRREKSTKAEKAAKADEEDEDGADAGNAPGPLKPNITFREYVYIAGSLHLALGWEDENDSGSLLAASLSQINHFGKRGCFFQLQAAPQWSDEIHGYTELTRKMNGGDSFPAAGLIQMMDDMDPKATFDNVNTFSDARGARLHPSIVLPYRRVKSSKGYTCYQRIEGK